MALSNVPEATFGPQGVLVPAVSDILAGVIADFQAAFGGGFNPSLATPQGQWATTLAACIDAANEVFLAMAQGVDPAFATGRMQDAIGRIYFLQRNPATATAVIATCVGAVGTVLPAGTQALDIAGNIYVTVDDFTIAAPGNVDATFYNQKPGPIPCPANTLNVIYKAVSGWDTVNNAADGITGRNVEGASQFEARRSQSVAQNARNTNGAILGALLSVPNVADAYVWSNDTNAGVTHGGVAIAANSLYCAVAGGDPATIAKTIWTKKPPGIPTVGTTTETVEDTNSGYSPPYPSYTINFEAVTVEDLFLQITLTNSTAVPAGALGLIQTVVQTALAGNDGGPPARIGSTVYASRFYAGIAALGNWAQIRNIKIDTAGPPAQDEITVNVDKIPAIPNANITLVLV